MRILALAICVVSCAAGTVQGQETLAHQEALELACIDTATTLQESRDCRAKVKALFLDAGGDR